MTREEWESARKEALDDIDKAIQEQKDRLERMLQLIMDMANREKRIALEQSKERIEELQKKRQTAEKTFEAIRGYLIG